MNKRFQNYGDLTSSLAFDLIERIKNQAFGAFTASPEYGASNQSCSAYVTVWLMDDEGEGVEDLKIRFSDHADRHGSDLTIKINDFISTIEDGGDYIATEISEHDYAALLDLAVTEIEKLAGSL